jgi:hypothetical protein
VKKRPHGTGALVERAPGSGTWTLRVAFGKDPVTGKLRRKTWTFEARGRRAAERQAARLNDCYEQDGIVGTRATVEQLLEEFMRFSVARGRSLTTLAEYRRIVTLGHKQVGQSARSAREVTKELGCDWHAVNDTVVAYGRALIDKDSERFGVAHGLDEVLCARLGAFHERHFATRSSRSRTGNCLTSSPAARARSPLCG